MTNKEIVIIAGLIIIGTFFYLIAFAQDYSTYIKRTDLPVTATVLPYYKVSTTTLGDLVITTNYKNVMLNASSDTIIVNNEYIK